MIARGWGKGRDELAEYIGVLGRETILYDTITVDTHNCTFVETHRRYNTKSEP